MKEWQRTDRLKLYLQNKMQTKKIWRDNIEVNLEILGVHNLGEMTKNIVELWVCKGGGGICAAVNTKDLKN
uniref:Uncharacterized protein n=1 Tax=Arion vulgaris TaxID=1028688 RepID=A0A0B7AQK9_9EUPU